MWKWNNDHNTNSSFYSYRYHVHSTLELLIPSNSQFNLYHFDFDISVYNIYMYIIVDKFFEYILTLWLFTFCYDHRLYTQCWFRCNRYYEEKVIFYNFNHFIYLDFFVQIITHKKTKKKLKLLAVITYSLHQTVF